MRRRELSALLAGPPVSVLATSRILLRVARRAERRTRPAARARGRRRCSWSVHARSSPTSSSTDENAPSDRRHLRGARRRPTRPRARGGPVRVLHACRRSSSGSTSAAPARRRRARPARAAAHDPGHDRVERAAAPRRRAGTAAAPGRLPRRLRARCGRVDVRAASTARAVEALGALVDGSLVREQDRGSRAWFTMLGHGARVRPRASCEAARHAGRAQERHAAVLRGARRRCRSRATWPATGRMDDAPPRRARRAAERRWTISSRTRRFDDVVELRVAALLRSGGAAASAARSGPG